VRLLQQRLGWHRIGVCEAPVYGVTEGRRCGLYDYSRQLSHIEIDRPPVRLLADVREGGGVTTGPDFS